MVISWVCDLLAGNRVGVVMGGLVFVVSVVFASVVVLVGLFEDYFDRLDVVLVSKSALVLGVALVFGVVSVLVVSRFVLAISPVVVVLQSTYVDLDLIGWNFVILSDPVERSVFGWFSDCAQLVVLFAYEKPVGVFVLVVFVLAIPPIFVILVSLD